MATFRKRDSGSWQARIQRVGYPDLTKSFRTKTEAKVWARQIEAEIDRGNYSAPAPVENDRTTLGELIDRYQVEVSPTKKCHLSELRRLKQLKGALGGLVLLDIQSQHIAAYRDSRLKEGKAPGTVIRELNNLSHIFSIIIKEWNYPLTVNPVQLIRKPSALRGRDRRLKPGELDLLLANLQDTQEVKQIVQLAVETGMRRSELLGMTWENIDTAKRVVLLPDTKNGDSREVPLSSRALEVLNSVGVKTEGPVFTTKPDSVSQAFSRACKRANLKDLRFHDLRHEATSRLFEKGLNTMEVSAITGHKTLSMLKRYTHLKASDLALRLG